MLSLAPTVMPAPLAADAADAADASDVEDDVGVGAAVAMYWIRLACHRCRARAGTQRIRDYRAAGMVRQANKIRTFVIWIMVASTLEQVS